MKNGSLFLPLQQMKDNSPILAACMCQMFVDKQLLVEGLNSLDGVKDNFEFTITKNYATEEKIVMNMEELKHNTCNTKTISIVLCFFLFVMLVIIGLGLFVQMKKVEPEKTEGVDINPDYGHGDEYGDGDICEVKDSTDYYFDDNPEDIAEITDVNEYYSND